MSRMNKGPVIQEWLQRLPWMQQTVLLTSLRGPDGIPKGHVVKLLLRWFRRCVLYSAFDGTVLMLPYDSSIRRGGSFTGASIPEPDFSKGETWESRMDELVSVYLDCVDQMPLHFHMHLIHAFEILGYKHPDTIIRSWWNSVYLRLVADLHLEPEHLINMGKRLGDNEENWKAEEARSRS